MIDLRPLYFGLAGGARLVRLDISGMYLVKGGVSGFWASLFWSAGVVLPLYILLMLLRFDPQTHDGVRFLFSHGVIYSLAWLIFPLIMERITAFIDRRQHYLRFIIGYNWLGCFYNLFFLLVGLAHASRMISWEAASAISAGLMLAGLVWIGHLAKHALEIPYSAAVGIVVLDLFMGVMINLLSVSLLSN